MDIRKNAERQWARQKYEVMAKSYRYYSGIRDRFREAKEEEDYLSILDELNELEDLSYTKKGFINTAEHLWGYFKKSATEEEKSQFFQMLEDCSNLPEEFGKGEPAAENLLSYIRETLLPAYPQAYLSQSSILK
ncbi:DUF1722 domain-containing protein [Fictibacillus fluitans]|uniref:DUF1722 domain-containing protein n=1 Tax=Fictibacillus fluitans TaxID=3058422 RepID=A0ABT8HVR7_9BACL|nr:DUF1722 domain-containing protein [Fictibacillus sp. NE201]MDN4524809.1 DUF1722 domain-containing protein [Fictibacillus sp. NE201]